MIVRPTWVYGPDDVSLNRFLGFGKKLPFIPMFGNGKQDMQPVFIDDVGRVAADAAIKPEAANKVFELGGPEVMSMNDVVKTALEVQGKERPLLHQPAAIGKTIGALVVDPAVAAAVCRRYRLHHGAGDGRQHAAERGAAPAPDAAARGAGDVPGRVWQPVRRSVGQSVSYQLSRGLSAVRLSAPAVVAPCCREGAAGCAPTLDPRGRRWSVRTISAARGDALRCEWVKFS